MAKDKSISVERPASKRAPSGWFSRRYPTSDAHDKAQANWRQRQEDKRMLVQEFMELGSITANPDVALEQLGILDEENRRAERERHKLSKVISANAA